MSASVEKAEVIQAIDSEIASANEQRKLDGITLWALNLAIVALIGMAASLWEANHLVWPNVAAMFLILTITSDAISSITMYFASDRTQSHSPFSLWVTPRGAAMVQSLLLLVVVLFLRHGPASWATPWGVLVFGLRFAFFAIADFRLLETFSKTAIVQSVWGNRENVTPLVNVPVRSYKQVKLYLLAIYLLLLIAYVRTVAPLHQGHSLRDARFAGILFLLMLLIGASISRRSSPLVKELHELRYDTLTCEISAPDAVKILKALSAGVQHAHSIYSACSKLRSLLSKCRSEADAAMNRHLSETSTDAAETQRLLDTFADVDAKVRQFLPIATATTFACELLSESSLDLLTSKIAELQAEYQAFQSGHCGHLAITHSAQSRTQPKDA